MLNLYYYLSLTDFVNTCQAPGPSKGDMRLNIPNIEEDTHVDRQWLPRKNLTSLSGGLPACCGDTSEEGVNVPAWKIREVSQGKEPNLTLRGI